MERLITAALDINMHLLSDLNQKISENYYQSFIDLAALDVYPMEFAKKIAPSTSLRNILSHEYQNIDQKKFHQALKIALEDYKKYAKCINRFIS